MTAPGTATLATNPHRAHPASPAALVRSALANRQLIGALIRRDVIGRYRGSIMGLAWSFLNPLLMLSIYTIVFSGIFKQKWPNVPNGGKAEYAVMLFVGLILHGLLAECITRSPGLVLAYPNYVKRVIFPLEILPWIGIGSALFHSVISFAVLLAAQVIVNHALPWTVVFVPIAVLPLLCVAMGMSWFLASIGVYVRDIGQITNVLVSVMMFLSPVFYSVSSIPTRFRPWMHLNPLTDPIEDVRGALVLGTVPAFGHIVVWCLVGAAIAQAGFWWFQRTRKGFADVI